MSLLAACLLAGSGCFPKSSQPRADERDQSTESFLLRLTSADSFPAGHISFGIAASETELVSWGRGTPSVVSRQHARWTVHAARDGCDVIFAARDHAGRMESLCRDSAAAQWKVPISREPGTGRQARPLIDVVVKFAGGYVISTMDPDSGASILVGKPPDWRRLLIVPAVRLQEQRDLEAKGLPARLVPVENSGALRALLRYYPFSFYADTAGDHQGFESLSHLGPAVEDAFLIPASEMVRMQVLSVFSMDRRILVTFGEGGSLRRALAVVSPDGRLLRYREFDEPMAFVAGLDSQLLAVRRVGKRQELLTFSWR